MKKLLWVGNSGDHSSFSRITQSVIPTLTNNFNVHLLTAARNKIPDQIDQSKVSITRLGTDTKTVTWEEFSYSWDMMFKTGQQDCPSTSPACQMKYSILQIADLNMKEHFDYILICNGIYESNWFVQTILESKINNDSRTILEFKKFSSSVKNESEWSRSELIVWTPIDYIPTFAVVRWVLEADYLFTMTPVMRDILIDLNKILTKTRSTNNKLIEWVGHGSNCSSNKVRWTIDGNLENSSSSSRTDLIDSLNKMRGNTWNGPELDSNDIIILNANNCVPRKRIDLTLKAFYELKKEMDSNGNNIKLWIHTDMRKFPQILSSVKKEDPGFEMKDVIVSHNNVSDDVLNMIYKVSQIGLQTSTGEGWSLTNLEHSLFNSIQVVPDFLATGFHFSQKNADGFLIKTTKTKTQNEAGHNVFIGSLEISDIVGALKNAVKFQRGLLLPRNKSVYVEGATATVSVRSRRLLDRDFGRLALESRDDRIKKAREYASSYKWSTEAEKLCSFLENYNLPLS
jgi:glycosyltransferase involved in cell wall biosynthesis